MQNFYINVLITVSSTCFEHHVEDLYMQFYGIKWPFYTFIDIL